MVKNGCDQSGLWTLKLTVSQEWNGGINRFFAGWHKFAQIKIWLQIFGVSMVNNGCGHSGDETLKLTVSEEWTDGINWFFACWYRISEIKIDQNFFRWVWSKMGVASLVAGL